MTRQRKRAPAFDPSYEPADIGEAMATEVEGEIREFVRRDVAGGAPILAHLSRDSQGSSNTSRNNRKANGSCLARDRVGSNPKRSTATEASSA
jgi:hypothetical protein